MRSASIQCSKMHLRPYSSPPDPLAGFKGAVSQREGEREGKEGKRKGGDGQGGMGRRGEVNSDAQLDQDCRFAKVLEMECISPF